MKSAIGLSSITWKVLKSKTIYDLDGFTDYLHRTGEQDAEIDEWLSEQANAA
jgi:hypothetical protein